MPSSLPSPDANEPPRSDPNRLSMGLVSALGEGDGSPSPHTELQQEGWVQTHHLEVLGSGEMTHL